ncbi:hypothetical protein PR202_ga24151 [Eleusine coracana subsp. coracana]|uniref:RING-type E3 ubiquitin transferase n=1 Tax=Eleusine coracana subsp. coracana TaxID=191504 RepID=A0AAV5D743_ELECO|nr:hypothetical protein QOZ80_1BG0050570 [Eleusine coracana subsp. coracana]GJN06422.1 hypothetical protein PR202_ga24151 [Eleusine coracana subsp. coracana]
MSSNPGAPSPCCSARTLLDAAATIVAFRFLLAVLFLFLCFVLLRQRWRRNDARVVQEQPPLQQKQPKQGLDAAAIALLPSFPYRRRRGVADAECAVCLGDLDEGQTVRRIPECGHVFHRECIDVWLATNASCPVCRGSAERAEERAAASCVVPIEMSDDETASSVAEETERVLSTRREAGSDDLA